MRATKTLFLGGLLFAACGGEAKNIPTSMPASAPTSLPVVGEVPAVPAPPPIPKPPEPTPEMIQARTLARTAECGMALGKREWDKLAGCYTDGAVTSLSGAPMSSTTGGKDAVEKFYKPLFAGFPDFQPAPVMVFVNGTHSAAVVYVTATNEGDWMGIPATKKKLGVWGMRIMDWDGDKMSADLHGTDVATWMAQLGIMKAPARKAVDPKNIPAQPEVVVAKHDATEDANLKVVDAMCQAFNKHDVAAAVALNTDDTVWTDVTSPEDIKGKKQVNALLKALFTAIPDMDGKCSMWAAGDYVIGTVDWTGTNKGAFPPFIKKATNKPLKIQDLEVYKLTGGKISHYWRFSNGLDMATQLGLVPPPGAAKPAPVAKPAKGKPKKPTAEKVP